MTPHATSRAHPPSFPRAPLLTALALLLALSTPVHAAPAISVQLITPSGALVPAADAELTLERLQNPRPGEQRPPERVAAWTFRTDAAGQATLPPLPAQQIAERDRLRVRFGDVELTRDLETAQDQGLNFFIRQRTRDTSALTLSLVVSVTPRDNGLQIEHLYVLQNPTQTLIDTDTGPGLTLPILTPAPNGTPAEALLPPRPDPNEFVTRATDPQARLVVERGNLIYRGLVDPDTRPSISIIYILPYSGLTSHVLGLRNPLPLTSLTFVVRTPPDLPLLAAPRLPASLVTRSIDGIDERAYNVVSPPSTPTTLLFDVQGTPDRHAFIRPLVTWLGLAIVLAILALALRRRTPL